jgi:hypothetical protein
MAASCQRGGLSHWRIWEALHRTFFPDLPTWARGVPAAHAVPDREPHRPITHSCLSMALQRMLPAPRRRLRLMHAQLLSLYCDEALHRDAGAIGCLASDANANLRVTVLPSRNGSLLAQFSSLSSSSGGHRHRFRHSSLGQSVIWSAG